MASSGDEGLMWAQIKFVGRVEADSYRRQISRSFTDTSRTQHVNDTSENRRIKGNKEKKSNTLASIHTSFHISLSAI